jgi:hypothetical protein
MKFSTTFRVLFLFLLSGFLKAQTTYTFTNAGATGRLGPSQAQVNSAYLATNLSGSVTSNSGVQQFTIPVSGQYQIEARGAQGAASGATSGGLGARMIGTFNFSVGTVLNIVVGQQGLGGVNGATGGGGGSYVATLVGNTPLLVAGGGSGCGNVGVGGNSAGTSSVGNAGGNCVSAGSTGFGGGSAVLCGDGAGGAGGFYGDGISTGSWGLQRGSGFVNGSNGGISSNGNRVGGFGGGAGTHANNTGGGAGGGYTGGGAPFHSGSYVGGAGSSFNAGTSQTNTAAFNSGQGLVIIQRLAGLNIVQTASVLCNGQLNAALSASVTGGTAPYTYSWSTGATTSSITGLGAGTYTCIATDAASLVFTASYQVTEPTSLFAMLTQTNVSCFGGTNGAINLTALGGTAPYSYTWMPSGGNSSLASNLTAGTYTCLISDNNACQTSVIVGVTQPAPVNVIGFATNTLVCYGQSSTLLGGGALFYSWTGGVTNGVAFVPSSTSAYTVTGTNASGCTGSAVVSVSVNPVPTLAISSTSLICSGNTATLSVTGADTYTWSTLSNSSSVSVSPAVTTVYTVAGTNSVGCQNSQSVTVSVINSNPVVTANTNSPVICYGFSTVLYGSGAVSYTWSGGITNNLAFTPSVSTSYTVTGGNACGTGSSVIQITVNPLPAITANASSTAVCIGNPVTLFGGGGVSYLWTGGVVNNSAFVPLVSSSYTVTGTDINGCTNTAVRSIIVNPLPNVSANVSNSVVCLGSSIFLTGSGAQTYSWTGGVTDGVWFSIPASMVFTVTGTDANGCQNTAVQSVTVLTVPVVTASISNSQVCAGATVMVNASGAATYTWSGGAINATAFVPLTSQVYTVLGANQCGMGSAMVSLTVNALPNVTANASNSVVCAGSTVALSGGGALSYTWSGGISNNTPFAPLVTGTYSVTGSDASGCTNTAVTGVTVNSLPVVTASVSNPVVCFGSQVILTGGGATSYTWSHGVLNGVAFVPSLTANYSVTGTDANGCQGSAVRSVTVHQLPVVTANANTTLICYGNSVVLNGSGANTYTWSGGRTNGVAFFPTANATYTVNGTNTLTGCTNTNVAVISISVNPLPVISASANPIAVCMGQSTTFSVSGADTYTWSGGVVTGVPFTPTNSSNYFVTGTNTLTGCSNVTTQSITVYALPVVLASSNSTAICVGQSVTLNGAGANTYTWTNGVQNGISFSPLSTSSYSVSGTNTLTGCTSTNVAGISIVVNPLPAIQIIATPSAVCVGGTVAITAYGTALTNWSHGLINGAPFSPAITTVYTVTGTNPSNGCSNTATQTIVVNALPSLSISASSASVCIGNSVSLSGLGADTYTWTGGIVNGTAFVPSVTSVYSLTGTHTLTGCKSVFPITQTITVLPLPFVVANSNTNTICFGNQVVLFGTGADTYTWTSGVLDGVPFSPTVTSGYTVQGTSTLSGCSSTNTATQTVVVNSLPNLQILSTDSLICAGENVYLTCNGATSFVWNDGTTGNLIIVSPSVSTTYTVTGTANNGCTNSQSFTQNVADCVGFDEEEQLQNLFVFYPNPNRGVFYLTNQKDLQLLIMDQLGRLVYETELSAGTDHQIETNTLSKGVYFLRGTSEGQTFIRKMVITE